jgi:hypothetical protein
VAEDERVVKYEEAKAILSDSGDVRILSLVKKARTKKIRAGCLS